jgi:TolB-like protein
METSIGNHMKTKIQFILITWLAGAMAQAAPPSPPTVAVYDFKGDGDAGSWGGKVTTLVTADLSTEKNLVLVERAELTKALNEEAFGVSGMVGSDAAAKIGQITGAKVLVAGQVILADGDHLVIVADIVGTETSRLFAEKVEGPTDNFIGLSSDLSRKIAKTITDQATNLVMPAAESREAFLERIVKSITGTNRPSVSVKVSQYNQYGNAWQEGEASGELGAILLKAGFTVVDDNSDQKPDLEITGIVSTGWGTQRGDLVTSRATLGLKVQERRTGNIIAMDREESTVTGVGPMVVEPASKVRAADELAGRILPLMAK